MPVSVPVPGSESRQLPPYRALLAVDAKDFTGLPSVQHAGVSELIPQLIDLALEKAGLAELRDAKRFLASTGDGIVFGFDPAWLPFVLWPFLRVLDEVLGEYNVTCVGPRIRLRASVHVGPVPDSGVPGEGDGNGTARNDTHRLLDSRPVKAMLSAASEQTTHLAAIISDRVYEDAVLGGYTRLLPDHCTEVAATVDGKHFAQRAWLYVPSPSGNLLSAGLPAREQSTDLTPEKPAADPAPQGPAAAAQSVARYHGNSQHVEDGAAVMGDVGGDLSFTGRSTTANRAANQHWGSGDNVSGTKNLGRATGDRG